MVCQDSRLSSLALSAREKLGISLGALSSILLASETPSLSKLLSHSSSSPLPLRFAVPPRVGRMAVVRAVTSAASSKPAAGRRGPRGIMKPRRVFPEIQALIGVPEIPRSLAVKRIGAYIRENNL